jgi:hypothetical protein
MPKVKSNAKWNSLSAENKKLLETWLFDEAISYKAAWERAREQWQFPGSLSSIRRFFERRARERTLADLADAGTEARAINETKVQTAELKNAALKVVARLLLKQVTEAPGKVSDWAVMARLLLRNEANENQARLQGERNAIRVAALELDRERFRENSVFNAMDHLPAVRKYEEARNDTSLSEYEVNAHMNKVRRSIFGDAAVPMPESEEEAREQDRKYREWQKSVAPRPLNYPTPPLPHVISKLMAGRPPSEPNPETPPSPAEPDAPITPPAP